MSTRTQNTFVTKSIAKMRQLWGGLALTALFALTNTAQADVVWGTAPPSDSLITWTDYTFWYTPKNLEEIGTTVTAHVIGDDASLTKIQSKAFQGRIAVGADAVVDVIRFIVPEKVPGQEFYVLDDYNGAGFLLQSSGLRLIDSDSPAYNPNDLNDLGRLPITYFPADYIAPGVGSPAAGTYYLSGFEDFDILSFLTSANAWGGALIVSFGAYDGGDNNASTPEPATMLIFGLGLAGLAVARRRRR
jgi:hypothetical protein